MRIHQPLLTLAILPFLAAAPATENEKLSPIFNGKSLDGWEQRNGTAKYTVEDGAIVGRTVKDSPNSFLCTKKPYGDFILELEVKDDPALNSGVQIRSHIYDKATDVLTENKGKKKRTHEAGRVHGYQVEISNEKIGSSGGVYEEAGRGWLQNIAEDPTASKAFHDNQWNKFRIVAIGDSIKTWVNGVACTNLIDSMEQSGFIGLQVHGGVHPAEVRFRNIRLQDLGVHVWRPLWDGKTMSGWTRNGGGEWTIENGALRGVSPAGAQQKGFLLSDRDFKNFTVRLQYKAVKGNSGFFFRMGDLDGKSPTPVGYEVEVDPTRDAGGLQEPRGRGWLSKSEPTVVRDYYKANDWNDMVVSAHGHRIVVHVNGVKTADFPTDPGRSEGRFGLQINPRQELEAMFRNIEILEPGKN